jgi:hypothetical protein
LKPGRGQHELVRNPVVGSWWATGEEQLRKALEAQELLPEP